MPRLTFAPGQEPPWFPRLLRPWERLTWWSERWTEIFLDELIAAGEVVDETKYRIQSRGYDEARGGSYVVARVIGSGDRVLVVEGHDSGDEQPDDTRSTRCPA